MEEISHAKVLPTVHTTSEVLMPKKKSRHHPLIYVWVALIIIITAISGYLTYRNIQLQKRLSTPSSFIECTNAPGSVIQEMFPPTCVTRDGVRFVQPPTE